MATFPTVKLPEKPNQHPRVYHTYSPEWEQWYFLMSDAHVDSSEHVDWLLDEHLAEASRLNAPIIDCGDFFDVINSRDDKRRSQGSMRSEDKVDDYVDSILRHAVKRFGKYANLFLSVGSGNHESKIIKLCGTDLTRRFVEELNRLRDPKLPPIYRAGYGGWVRFLFENRQRSCRQSVNLKHFHGSGGGGEVTKGAMEAHRMAASVADADIVVTGHVHEKWEIEHVMESINDHGVAIFKPRIHIKLGSYKLDYRLDGAGTWHMERGGKPKPLGGTFIRFWCEAGRRIVVETRKPHVNYARLGAA